MIVKELKGRDGRWDAFVKGREEGTFFHLSGWKHAIEKGLGHRCHFLYAEEGGEIKGVLPVVHVKSLLFGNGLISNGFCVYGGPLVADEAALAVLDGAAQALFHATGAQYLEYRCRRPLHPEWAVKDAMYVTFRRTLSEDHEANMKAIPRKQRAMVRKGIASGLTSEEDTEIDRLFAVYAESVRNLGTPVFPKKWFRALKAEFGEACQNLVILHEGKPVAGVMSFFFRDEVLPYYGGGTQAARPVAANDFMYWEAMRLAVDRGARLFDFGRSKIGTGSHDFKKHWGFEPEPLYYEFRLKEGESLPEVNPLNPKYQTMIAIWRRLPLAVANRMGPLIARNLG
jgi:FemAB-related protein (PEP-CTERM system-associated)